MFPQPPLLEGRTVRLETLSREHLDALYRHAHPDIFKHLLDWPVDDTQAAFVAYLERGALARRDPPAFAICLRDSGEAVGITSFLEIRPADKRLEIGSTWIGRAHQGSHVNPESKLLMFSWAFETWGARRVELKTSSENLRSQAAIERLGAVREGELRRYQRRANGRWRDTIMFSVTDLQWPTVKWGLQQRLGLTARDALRALLGPHRPADEKERADLDVMRRFADQLDDPFSRSEPEAHFTGSAVVVTPGGDRVCLLHHGKLNRWLQPGGHADAADGTMALTALREAKEETGCEVALHPAAPQPLDVDVHVIPARKTEPEHRHLDIRFLVVAQNPEALAHDPGESHGAQWLSWDDALARADEAPLRRLLEKARSLARQE